jgi:hypothetical protein
MRISRMFLACAATFFCTTLEAKTDLVTIDYTGYIPAYQIYDPYSFTNISYAGSSFTLTTVIDTNNADYPFAFLGDAFQATPTGFTVTSFNNQSLLFGGGVPGYASGSIGFWGGYGVSATLGGSQITQLFEGGINYHEALILETIQISASLGGGGSGSFTTMLFDQQTDGPYPAQINFLIDSATSTDIAASVPEPSTWAMLLNGFVGIGFAGYRKPAISPSLSGNVVNSEPKELHGQALIIGRWRQRQLRLP